MKSAVIWDLAGAGCSQMTVSWKETLDSGLGGDRAQSNKPMSR